MKLFKQKLALTSPTGGGRSVGMVRSRTKATEFSLVFFSYLNWVDQVNYTAQKAWKALLHFVMCVLKTGNRNTKHLAYTSLVHPILEYGSACWDPCREGQIM